MTIHANLIILFCTAFGIRMRGVAGNAGEFSTLFEAGTLVQGWTFKSGESVYGLWIGQGSILGGAMA